MVATPVVALELFVVTLFPYPIGVLLLALYGATVYLARVYAITYVGQILIRRQQEDSSSLPGPSWRGWSCIRCCRLFRWSEGC
ncbi:MAG: hypothetical protein IPM88_20880 [Nitrospira sp.]|nr:hypothetical protein [Nitrospira sp.]